MGRKSKLTPEVQEGIVKALAVGATHEQAYGYMGIGHDTFYKWLRWGAEGRAPYAEFADAVKKTEQQASVGWLAFIEAAARNGQWQAAAWKLERRYPKVWGRQLADADAQPLPDIHVHVHTARERLTTRLHHLWQRHLEDAADAN